jgi:hypothetical protein
MEDLQGTFISNGGHISTEEILECTRINLDDRICAITCLTCTSDMETHTQHFWIYIDGSYGPSEKKRFYEDLYMGAKTICEFFNQKFLTLIDFHYDKNSDVK